MRTKPNYTGQEYYSSSGDEYGYIVDETGYIVYKNWAPYFNQHEPHIPDARKTYAQNAIAQIEELIAQEEAIVEENSQQDRIEQAVSMILANQMMEV